MDHVAGYVLALDMTARHIQEKLKKMQHPWLLCKGKKIHFCVLEQNATESKHLVDMSSIDYVK
jgi:2-keto-4-pentenoate hydratase/2-oxohepta-3-ene-1,7-dioic acid hydratase in catechol pathway